MKLVVVLVAALHFEGVLNFEFGFVICVLNQVGQTVFWHL